MAKKQPVAEPKKPRGFDIKALGMRQVPKEKMLKYMVKREGFAGEVPEWKPTVVMVSELQSDLNIKEAKALKRVCGEQEWFWWAEKDRYYCVTEHEGTRRRFMITKEIHAELEPEAKVE